MGFNVRAKCGYACAAIVVYLLLSAAPCRAAKFRLVVPQPAAPMGQESEAFVVLVPENGEKVMGAWLTLTVNKDYLLLLGDRSQYASDPVFSKVEKFSADPLTGALTYRVQTAKPVTQPKVLLRVPLKFVQVGVSSITYTASYYDADVKRQPANSGYQRVAGYKDAPDPMLLSSLFGENNTLDGLSVTQNLTIMKTEEQSMGALEMDLGVTALEEVQSDEQADVVIEFSKRVKTIGRGQWVRLDVMVTKFPEYETLGGVQFKVKYDPNYFTYTDDKGQEAATVVVNDVFNLGFVNKVDRVKGEISLSLGVDLLLSDLTLLKTPVSTVSLYFKCMREGTGTVTLEDVKVPVSRQGSKLSRHDAIINISGSEKGCDSDLPATLCSGTFKTTGEVRFSLNTQNEIIRTAVRRVDGINTTENKKVNKYYLEQAWNLNMGGSFKNGVRLQGHLEDTPISDTNLSISLIGADTTAMFGDFNMTIAESDLVSLSAGDATGLMFTHKYKGLTFRGVTAELNSSSTETPINGLGHRGPYVVNASGGSIIQSSFGVYKNGEALKPEEYTMDYARNQISFTEPLLTNESVVLKYKVSSLLFSTGNIQAFRLNYENKPGTFDVGTTYITTASPKSNTLTKIITSETVDTKNEVQQTIDGVPVTSFVCGFFGDHMCVELQLKNAFIVPGSMNIISDNLAGKKIDENDTQYIHIEHRGYLEGRFFIDLNKFGTVKLTVSYSYYNPSVITQQSFDIYVINNKNSTLHDLGHWRTDMFPGSEVLYLSDDTNYDVTEGQDQIVCYKHPTEDFDKDDTFFCPGNYSPDSHMTYYIQGNDSNQYVVFNGGVPVADKQYLKIKYIPVPPDISGGSEFQKVAWGVDTKFKIGGKTTVKAEYAQANSDLSSLNTINEVIEVDSLTDKGLPHNEPPTTRTCWYLPTSFTGTSDEYLACRLNRTNLFGSITIKIQKCKTWDSLEKAACLEYSPTESNVLIPMSDVNLREGLVYFWRSKWPSATSVPFPDIRDKFYITYTYEQTLDEVVTGEASLLDLTYDSRAFKVNLKKRSRDPLFDKDLSSFRDNITDLLNGDFTLALGRQWSATYNFKTTREEVVDKTGILSSLYERPSSSFSLKFSPGTLSSIQFSRNENKTSGYSLGAQGQRTNTETYSSKDAWSASYATKDNRYALMGSMSKDKNEYREGTQQDTESTSQLYSITISPSKKFSLMHTIGITSTDPIEQKATSRGYSVTIKTFPIVDVKLGYTQNRTRNTINDPVQLTEDKNYTLSFKPFMGIENMTFNFTRNDKPGGTTAQLNRQRNDNLSLSFRTKLKKIVTISPTYSRSSSSTESQSWSLTHATGWSLDYTPPSRFSPKVSVTQNRSSVTNNTSAGTTLSQSFSFTLKRTLSLSFNPTKKSSSTIAVDSSAGSSKSRNFKVTMNFHVTPNITLDTGLNISKDFGTSPSKTTYQNFGFNWNLSVDTDFNLKYSRSVTRNSISTSQSLPTTTISAGLTTKFK